MRPTPLQQMKSELLQDLQQEIELQKQHIQQYQQIQLEQQNIQQLQHNYQQKLLQQIELLELELSSKNEMLKNYQVELSKEPEIPDLSSFLIKLEPKFSLAFSEYLQSSAIQVQIKHEIQKAMAPHLNSLQALDSVDWSNMQSVFSLQKSMQEILKDIDSLRLTLQDLIQIYKN